MKKITYERLQGCPGIRIVAGYIEKTDSNGDTYFNVFCRYKAGNDKVEHTDFTTLHSREQAIKNSRTMLDMAVAELNARGLK